VQVKSESDIFDTVRGLWTGHALLAAHELGVLALLWHGDYSTDQIAQRLSLDPRGTSVLLSTLRSLGIVDQAANSNTLTPIGTKAADPNGSLAGYLGFHTLLLRSWAELPECIRRGGSGDIEPNRTQSPELVMQYIKAMDALGQPVADELAAALDVKPGEKVLDLGGGSGVYARAILRRQPEAHVVLVDRPVVIQMLRKSLMAESGAVHNLQLVEGDYFTFDGKRQFDLVLLANVVHNESAEDNVRIVQTCAKVLRPGGHLAVLDYFMGAPTRNSPVGFDLLLLLISNFGRLYSRNECQSWLRRCSLNMIDSSQVGRYDLVRAQRR